jgi:hypothetical protein
MDLDMDKIHVEGNELLRQAEEWWNGVAHEKYRSAPGALAVLASSGDFLPLSLFRAYLLGLFMGQAHALLDVPDTSKFD